MPFSAKLLRGALERDGLQQLPEQQRRQPIKSLPQLDSERWPTSLFWTGPIGCTSYHSLKAMPPLSKPAKELGTGNSAQSAGWTSPSESTSGSVLLWTMLQTTLDNPWKQTYTWHDSTNYSWIIDGHCFHLTSISTAMWNDLSNQAWPIPLPEVIEHLQKTAQQSPIPCA